MPAQIESAFGRIALAKGMVSPAQLDEAVKAMKRLSELGFHEKLGAVMLKKGYITEGQVQEILREQGSRARNRISGYEVLSKLGQGGMGAVFRARQVSLDRPVALKILSPSLAKDKAYVERFLREARAVARLNHPNIIQGIDVGESNGYYYFAMEYIDGPTLAAVIKNKGPLDEKMALRATEQVAQALAHAQRHGLIHRDIKPDNVMLTAKGQAKLCDLGLAKFFTGDSAASSIDGETSLVVGTPHYISPEQAKGEKTVDIRSDIYSLGATLFHALTGRTPFTGTTAALVMTKHVTEPVDDPRSLRPDISEETALLIGKMMAKRTADRYATPEDLLEDVRAVQRGRTPRAAASTARPGVRLGGPARPGPKPSATGPRPVRRRGRSRQPDVMQYIVVAVVALLIMGLVIYFLPMLLSSIESPRCGGGGALSASPTHGGPGTKRTGAAPS